MINRLSQLALPAALLPALLAGCSNPEDTARYLIDPPRAAANLPNRLGTVELKDVSLPQYASGDEVAWQSTDGAVRSTPDDLWADSPRRAFTQTLASEISAISGATVIAEPWPLSNAPDSKLDVRVDKALAQADGIYRLTGRYFLSDESLDGGDSHVRSFDIAVPLARAEDSDAIAAGAVAAAQSQAIAQLAAQIATLGGSGTTFRSAPKRSNDPFALDPIF